MARLVIELDIGVDPTLEDPFEVADALLADCRDVAEYAEYCGVRPDHVSAEWRADA